jgi:hypothetical protein
MRLTSAHSGRQIALQSMCSQRVRTDGRVTQSAVVQLDPALVRPGRINKRLYLGPMRPAEAARMAAHHYPGASAAELSELRASVPADLVPARLEALCTEHELLGGLASELRGLGSAAVAAAALSEASDPIAALLVATVVGSDAQVGVEVEPRGTSECSCGSHATCAEVRTLIQAEPHVEAGSSSEQDGTDVGM